MTHDVHSKLDALIYPECIALKLEIKHDGLDEIPGINPSELKLKMPDKLFMQWTKWAGNGLTWGPNRIYPWDVEDFLEGKKNWD